MKYIDLHLHTIYSDGTLTPKQLVDKAVKVGLKAIAITDHNSISGIKEAVEYADNKIEFIPGIEISCDESDKGLIDIHVIGLFIDYKNEELINLLKKIKKERILQKKKIIEKLNKFGIKVTFEEVRKITKGEVGRPHIAKIVLKNNPDKFKNISEIFEKYIKSDGPAFVKREDEINIKQAIGVIHNAGGLAFLAHPGFYPEEIRTKLIKEFISYKGDGLETNYPYYLNRHEKKKIKKDSDKLNKIVKKIAKANNLLETAGSDFHGNKFELGDFKVNYNILEKLKEK